MKILFLISFLIHTFIELSYCQLETTIDYLNKNTITSQQYQQKSKNLCNYSNDNEFMRQYIGGQLCNNDYIFEWTNLPPHYERSIRIDIIFMNDNTDQSVMFNVSDNLQNNNISYKINIFGVMSRLQRNCINTDIDKEKDFDQFYRGNWYQKNINGRNVKVTLNESCSYYWGFKTWTDDTLKQLKIGTVQLNITPCDPSCLTCSDRPDQCLACSEIKQGSTCICNNPNKYLYQGICVDTCNNTEYYFGYNKKCIYIFGCQQINDNTGKCLKCIANLYLFDFQSCINACPVGFIMNQFNQCVDQFNYPSGVYLMKGALSSNSFSEIEIKQKNIVMTNYLKMNDNGSIISQCGDYQLLGGFYINQKGTTIQFGQYQNNYQFVLITFKYILIDMKSNASKALPNIAVIAGSAPTQQIDASSAQSSSNICGLENNEWIGQTSHIFTIPQSSSNLFYINIQNNNNDSVQINNNDTPHEHSYFGIREITIMGYNCSLENCLECDSNGNGCTKCNPGYYFQYNQCLKCQVQFCDECNGQNSCQQCKQNMKIDQLFGQCQCIDGTVFNDLTQECERCYEESCLQCSGSQKGQCLECKQGKYKIINNTQNSNDIQCIDCINLDGMYQDDTNKTCNKCSDNCKTCSGSLNTQCSQCLPNYSFDENHNCIICSNTQYDSSLSLNQQQLLDYQAYYVDIQNYCKKCHLSCLTCSGSNINECTECKPNTYLYNYICQSSCPDGYYINNKQCSACDESCLTCSNGQSQDCITCKANLYFSINVNNKYCKPCDIQNGYFIDQNNYCKACFSSDCKVCTGQDQINCNICQNDMFKYEDGSCSSLCDTDNSMYIDQNNNNKQCNKCVNNCKICSGSLSSQCSQCLPNYSFDENHNCIICQNTIFDSSLQLNEQQQENYQAYYIDNQNYCKKCHSSCLICSGSNINECTECKSNTYLFNDICSICPDGYYINGKQCSQCHASCQTCTTSNSNSNCSKCNNNLSFVIIDNNKYCKSCDIQNGYFIDQNNDCQSCYSSDCIKCNGKDQINCQICKQDMFKYEDGSCSPFCDTDDSMYIKQSMINEQSIYYSQQCLSCNINQCQKCNGNETLNQCIQCKDGYYLNIENNTCVECRLDELGWYRDENTKQCIRCHSSCGKCTSSKITDCITCNNNPQLYLIDNLCISCDNLIGYYKYQSQCIKCQDSNCDVCNENGCMQCKNKYYKDEQTNICLECTSDTLKYYIDNNNGSCQKCHANCLKCYGPQSNQCNSCSNNYFILPVLSPNTCQLCPESTGSNNNEYQIYSKKDNCELCDWQCTICGNNNYCKKCACKKCMPNYFLSHGICISSCTSYGYGYVYNLQNQSCMCNPSLQYEAFPIKYDINKNPNNDIDKDNFYFDNTDSNTVNTNKQNFCSNDIPIGYYCNENKKCQQCSNNDSCYTCESKKHCKTCIEGYFLWQGQCTKECYPDLNIFPNHDLKICECTKGYILIQKQYSLDIKKSSQDYCDAILAITDFKIDNALFSSSQSNESSSSSNITINDYPYEINKLIIILNRIPSSKELEGFKCEITDNYMKINNNYKIENIQFSNKQIILDISSDQNYKISKITIFLNSKSYSIQLTSTILLSKNYTPQIPSQQTIKEISSSMESLSSVLTGTTIQNQSVKQFVDLLKTFQLLCLASNFVQLLAPITLIKDSLPPSARYGAVLGASFLFPSVPSPNSISFSSTSSSSINTNNQISQSQSYSTSSSLNKLNQTQYFNYNQSNLLNHNPSHIFNSNQSQFINNNSTTSFKDKTNYLQDQSNQPQKLSDENIKPDNLPSVPEQEQQSKENNNIMIKQFGLKNELHDNFLMIQIIIIVSSFLIILCLTARYFLIGKQHTLTIVNKLSNFLCSYIQSWITPLLFALSLSFEQSTNTVQQQPAEQEQLYLCIIQILCHIIFIIELIYLMKVKSIEQIQQQLPNMFENINGLIKGSKSYVIISLIKKYLVISLLISLRNHAFHATIIVAVIFGMFALYLIYFRFFISLYFNIIKIMQEIIICAIFAVIAASININMKMLDNNADSASNTSNADNASNNSNANVVSNKDLDNLQLYGQIILVLFLISLIISLILFMIRTILAIKNIFKMIAEYRKKKKETSELNLMIEEAVKDINHSFSLHNHFNKNKFNSFEIAHSLPIISNAKIISESVYHSKI